MSEVFFNQTHFMTFPHTVEGSISSDWTLTLLKDGQLVRDVPVEITELTGMIYVCSFENNAEGVWTLIAQDSNDTDRTYVETWKVRKNTLELNVQQVRSTLQGDGGFFGKNTEQE